MEHQTLNGMQLKMVPKIVITWKNTFDRKAQPYVYLCHKYNYVIISCALNKDRKEIRKKKADTLEWCQYR